MDLVRLRTSRNGRRAQPPPLAEERVESLRQSLSRAVRGEVRFDTASRALYATDASNYRQVPIGVVIPTDAQDVFETVRACREHDAPILARGGGTSLAGQCCNVAVVLDFTKRMGRVLQIDPERRRARVQPGTVLDELRRQAAPYGLTFGPDPATHTHCTLGGMIGNNSCGVHSLMSELRGPGPRVEDNVEELEVLTYDGVRLSVGRTPEAELARIIAAGGRRGEIYARLRMLADRYAPLIRSRFPKIARRVSGYNLPELLPESGFDLGRALVGTEGTCALLLEATVTLIEEVACRALLLAGYPDLAAAAAAVPRVRELGPIGLEGVDDRLVQYNREKSQHAAEIARLPPGNAWLFVELGADSAQELRTSARRAARALERGRHAALGVIVVETESEQKALWELRESGLGATAFVPGHRATWEGWEDAAVPPERLASYLAAFRALLDRFG
jgi:FAD/FMN-containing dehydrogenase